jgi:hypothetical protein
MMHAQPVAPFTKLIASLAAMATVDLSATPWRRIELSEREGVWCLVDAEDYGWLAEHNWNIWHSGRSRWQQYAKRNTGVSRATVRMHREIMLRAEPRDDVHARLFVDHVNGCTLDNRRANLRWATPLENARNTRAQGEAPTVEAVLFRLMRSHAEQIQQLQDIPF